MKSFAYGLGIVGLLFIASAALMIFASSKFEPVKLAPDSPCPQPPEGLLPGGFKGHIIAIEFARSACDVELIIGGEGHANRAVMKRVLSLDNLFILSYLLLYLLMGFLLMQSGSRWAAWIGMAAIACGIATAAFDVIENAGVRQVISTPLSATTPEMVLAIRDATLVKWCLSFVVSLLLAAALFYIDAEGWLWWVGFLSSVFFLVGALVGFIGLHYHKLIGLTIPLQFFGLLGLIYLAMFHPQVFLWKD